MNRTFISWSDVRHTLLKREHFLEEIEQQIIQPVHHFPEGCLRVSNSEGRIQYFWRQDRSDPNGTYIPFGERGLAAALAEKDYTRKMLKSLQTEHKIISRCLKHSAKAAVENIYPQMSEGRKLLIAPIIETDEQYLQKWRDFHYEPLQYPDSTPLFPTDHGEMVRSKSEWIIANELYKGASAYRYEAPLYLNSFGTVYPDFTVLNLRCRKELYWEHLGMVDNPDYLSHNLQKIYAYMQNGYYPGDRLIVTAETRQCPLNIQVVKLMVKRFCN